MTSRWTKIALCSLIHLIAITGFGFNYSHAASSLNITQNTVGNTVTINNPDILITDPPSNNVTQLKLYNDTNLLDTYTFDPAKDVPTNIITTLTHTFVQTINSIQHFFVNATVLNIYKQNSTNDYQAATGNGWDGNLWAEKFTGLPSGQSISKLALNTTSAAGNLRVKIYQDNGVTVGSTVTHDYQNTTNNGFGSRVWAEKFTGLPPGEQIASLAIQPTASQQQWTPKIYDDTGANFTTTKIHNYITNSLTGFNNFVYLEKFTGLTAGDFVNQVGIKVDFANGNLRAKVFDDNGGYTERQQINNYATSGDGRDFTDYVWVEQFSGLEQGEKIISVLVWVTNPSGNIRVKVYSDSGGSPGSLLGESGAVAASGFSVMNDIHLTAPATIPSGGIVWAGYEVDSPTFQTVYDNNILGHISKNATHTFGPGPSSLFASSTNVIAPKIGITYGDFISGYPGSLIGESESIVVPGPGVRDFSLTTPAVVPTSGNVWAGFEASSSILQLPHKNSGLPFDEAVRIVHTFGPGPSTAGTVQDSATQNVKRPYLQLTTSHETPGGPGELLAEGSSCNIAGSGIKTCPVVTTIPSNGIVWGAFEINSGTSTTLKASNNQALGTSTATQIRSFGPGPDPFGLAVNQTLVPWMQLNYNELRPGAPGTLLGESGSVAAVSGVNGINVTSTIPSSGIVWGAFEANSSSLALKHTTGLPTGTAKTVSHTFGIGPDPFGVATNQTKAPWMKISLAPTITSSEIKSNTLTVSPANPPSAPTGLTATTISDTQINLSWTAPTDNGGSSITGYKIERKIGTGSYSILVPNTGSTATTYSDTGLTSGTTYIYRVSAINSVGTGSTSNEATAMTFMISTDPRMHSSGEQRVSYFDGTRNWIFYYSGTSIAYRYSSDNGLTFSGSSTIPSSSLLANSYFGVYGEGNDVVVSWSTSSNVITKKGTINPATNTINWDGNVNVFPVSGSNKGQQYYPSFEKVGSNLFLGFNVINSAGKNTGRVYSSPDLDGPWTAGTTLYTGQTNPGIVGVAKYATNKAIAVYALYGNTEFKYRTFSGTWSGEFTTSNAGLTGNVLKTNAFSITSDGTCAWVGYVPSNAGGDLKSLKYCDGTGATPVPTPITGTNLYPTIGSENGNIHILYLQGSIIRAITNFNVGTITWQQEVKPFGNTFDNAAHLHAQKSTSTAASTLFVPVVWRENAGTQYSVNFGISNPFNWINSITVVNDNPFDKVQVEPHVTASKSSSSADVVVSGYIQIEGANPANCAVSRSLDSGLNWLVGTYNASPSLPKGGQVSGGDPVITSYANGTFVYVCNGNTIGTSPGTGYKYLSSSSLSFVKSTDNGATWTEAREDLIATTESLQIDKPWIAAEWGVGSTDKVYACWTEFDYINHETRITFAQVLPTYTHIKIIDSAQWVDDAQRRMGPYVQGCQIATGPGKSGLGNEIFLVYEKMENYNTGKIFFNRNYDGGDPSSWLSTPIQIGTFQRYANADNPTCSPATENRILDGCLNGVLGFSFRSNHIPSLTIDKLGDPHVVWTTYGNNNADLLYTSSYNCATSERQCSFAPQVTLDTSTNDQFEPAILVSDSSVNPRGIIIVTANDKREDNISSPNETWKPWAYSCQPTSSSGTGSCLLSSDWFNSKIKDNESTFANTNGFAGDYHGITSTKTNQAINVYHWRYCEGCPTSLIDVLSQGAK